MERNKIKLIILAALCLFVFSIIPLLGLHFYTFNESSDAPNRLGLMDMVFYGFGVNAILMIFVGIALLFPLKRLREVSVRGQRVLSVAWILFIFTFVSASSQFGAGNWMIVAKEGWSGLYKHPFVWLILVLLVGNIVLYFFKPKNDSAL